MYKAEPIRSAPTLKLGNYKPQVVRKDNLIRGVVAMQSGVEALGHGVMADKATLDTLAQLGNAKSKGVRGRFGHPAMSENTTGKQLQVAKNFSVVPSKGRAGEYDLIHDSYLVESARNSPAFTHDAVEWVMTAAEKNPSELGESVVISTYFVWLLKDGSELNTYYDPWDDTYVNDNGYKGGTDSKGRPYDATTPLPLIRPVEFHYVDFVNEGALTHDGMFPASAQFDPAVTQMFAGRSSEFAAVAFRFADEFRRRYNMPLDVFEKKMGQLTRKYISMRKDKGIMENENNEFEEGGEGTGLGAAIQTLDELEAEGNASPTISYATTTQVEALSTQIATLQSTIDQLSGVVVRLTQEFAVTKRNVRRLSGESVATEVVPSVKPVTMESLAAGAPALATAQLAPTKQQAKVAASALAPGDQASIIVRAQQRASRLGSN